MPPFKVTGTLNLIDEGVRALEALRQLIYVIGDSEFDLAEFRLYENMPIEAVLSHAFGHVTHVWTGETWEAVEA